METQPGTSRSHQSDDAEGALNLTLFGSPAPRYVRQTPRPKPKMMMSPCSSTTSSVRRPLVLPVDRILLLRDRLSDSLGCDLLSDRESSLSSSHPDLSLDLSSVNDSAHETDSSDDFQSPVKKPQLPKRVQKGYWGCDSCSSTQSTPPTHTKTHPSSSAPLCSNRPTTSTSYYSPSGQTSRGRTTDLICLYVDTVNNTQLAKYFRPCAKCNETSCSCPASEPIERPSSRCSDFSQFLLERRFSSHTSSPETGGQERRSLEVAVDSGNSTLQIDETSRSSIVSRNHVSLSLMQLSTAAQCARILADSLDSVLQLAREEVTSQNSNQKLTSPPRNVDDLQSVLETLQKNYLIPEDTGRNMDKPNEQFSKYSKDVNKPWGGIERSKSAPGSLRGNLDMYSDRPGSSINAPIPEDNQEMCFEDDFCCRHCLDN